MPEFDVDKYNIPPAIKDMILKLRDKRIPLHIRNNYKMMMENIIKACTAEVTIFNETPLFPAKKSVAKRR